MSWNLRLLAQISQFIRYQFAQNKPESYTPVLLITDHFSTFSSAMLINSEKAEDLKAAIILLTSNIRHPGPISISTDSAAGFSSLAKGDKQLQDLNITVETRDPFNKNFNAVVDHACQELENEIRKLLPEGGSINQFQLSAATLALYAKLRRKGTLSAYEIHSARSLHSGNNLQLSDAKLRQNQIAARESSQPGKASTVTYPQPGDTVTPLNTQPKHSVRNMYLVTSSSPDSVTAQKILHPLSHNQTKFTSKQYVTKPKFLRVLHRPT